MEKQTKNLYDNCKVFTLDGEFGGFIGRGSYNWYLAKGLATKKDDNSIILNFQPDMNGLNEFKKEEIPRENKCVVCGDDDNLCKINTIGHQYRCRFPDKYKRRRSWTIVVLCYNCSGSMSSLQHMIDQEILNEYGISKDDISHIFTKFRKMIKNIQNGMNNSEVKNQTLIKAYGHLPTKEEIENILKELDSSWHNHYKEFKSVYDFIVNDLIVNNKIHEFELRWIKEFIDNLEPEYLPHDFLQGVAHLEEITKINHD